MPLPRNARRRLRELADEELMALMHRGEVNAFEVVYERHGSVAYGLAYRMLGTRAAAEDAVQEAFLALWRAKGYDPGRGSVRTWILSIVRNRSIDALRRARVHDRRRGGEDALDGLVDPSRTDTEALRRQDAREVRSALDALPPDQLQVVELAYFGGFSHSEIAELIDAPLGTIKGRMRLALGRMREQLEPHQELAP